MWCRHATDPICSRLPIASPAFSGRPGTFFSHLRWNFVYQRPQHLLSRLARGRRVYFFEEPVFSPGEPGWTVPRRPTA